MTRTRPVVRALMLAGAVAVALAYVWVGWRGRVLAAELSELQAQQRVLFDEQDELRAEITALSRVERIKEIAVAQIGLVDPELPPIDVPAIAHMGRQDSLEAERATGLELLLSR